MKERKLHDKLTSILSLKTIWFTEVDSSMLVVLASMESKLTVWSPFNNSNNLITKFIFMLIIFSPPALLLLVITCKSNNLAVDVDSESWVMRTSSWSTALIWSEETVAAAAADDDFSGRSSASKIWFLLESSPTWVINELKYSVVLDRTDALSFCQYY